MPNNELRVKELNKIDVFTKEVNMYAEVLPAMVRFQKEKKIQDGEILSDWPSCLTSDGGAGDFVAMENLRGQGYKMADRTTGLSHPQVLLVLSTLAKFHAISFAQFGGDGAKILSTYPFLEEKMFPDPTKEENSLKDYSQSVLRCEVKLLRDTGHLKEAETLALFCHDNTIDPYLLSEISRIASDTTNGVISHGDCWTNNIMFLYDHEDKVIDLKLLDFQIARCAPRSVEVSYFLYACVPHLDVGMEEEYLKWYDGHFIQFLKKLGVNRRAGDGLDFQDFMEEYENCMFYGVMLGLIMTPMMCIESQNQPSLGGQGRTLSLDQASCDSHP
ncbi:uncharacterized protein LOC110857502 [Folsomia candida]|uniref:uncharacterized protein LOC110857502 n=1 Tax=Folsomia candida TaxID=158441 RepID=UPI0016052974|nr:uncharacterized protein LOC110857502 [Folsomia candida]